MLEKRSVILFFVIALSWIQHPLRAYAFVNDGFMVNESVINVVQDELQTNDLYPADTSKAFIKKKTTAAILALTLGMLGVHRLYLGTKPWVPAAYLFTFGGGFFLLPVIDFVAILLADDLSRYENNNQIIMHIK
jgi:TM2 domain-containing membrane protein YozV